MIALSLCAALWALLGSCVGLAAQAGSARADPFASRSKGSSGAPVTVYEMADFQCPACRTFALETQPLIDREYVRTGRVRWVFVNFPLTSIHPNAVAAAEVAMCAARQDKFWAMHDVLFQRQPQWGPLKEPGPYLVGLGDSAGLDRRTLLACLDAQATRAEVEADAQRAYRAGARATPTFYIEGGLLRGAAPIETFRAVLDSIHGARTGGQSPRDAPPPPP